MAEAEDVAASGAAFDAGDASKALEFLSKVRTTRENDPKVLHNTAVAEYVAGGCREPRKLLATLEALKQRLEDARAEEFGEGDNLGGDTDPSLTVYNMAVLLYQMKQYAKCRTLLEDMFSNIEPVDEFLAFKLCFLLLDVYLLQRHAERAAEVLAYLEKSFAALTKADGGKENGVADGAAAEPPAAPTGTGDWPNKRSSTRRPPTDISADEVRATLATFKAKLALLSRASRSSSKREIKTTLNACAPNTTGLFLKCNLEWQRQNYRKAIKLLNNSCQSSERDKNIPALYFNNLGCIHHCMRRHAAASFYFGRALHENETYLASAPAPTGGDDKAGSVPTPSYSCDRRCEISYNRGVQQLLSGRPRDAFDSFLVAAELTHSQPRTWLRLGECCVAVYVLAQRDEAAETGVAAVSPLVASLAVGPRPHALSSAGVSSARYLVLGTDGPLAAGKDGSGPPAEDTDAPPGATIGAPAPAAPTLAYGVRALRNALLLCNVQLGTNQLGALTAAEHANLLAAAASGTLSSADEAQLLLHGVARLALLHLSWIALVMKDYVPALSWASQLLGLDACPAPLKAYAHIYACDALVNLGRVPDALEQLTSAIELNEPLVPVASATGADASAAAEGEAMESVKNPYAYINPPANGAASTNGGGRGALYTNLAVVHILQGDATAAESYTQQALAAVPDEPRTLLVATYLELKGGRTENALELLKKQRLPPKQ